MSGPLNELLRATSRSFYLTLRVLPGAIRPQIGLAYLLARTTDTIADTEILPVESRLDALQKLRERLLEKGSVRSIENSSAQGTGSSSKIFWLTVSLVFPGLVVFHLLARAVLIYPSRAV